jgi:hypothetical protein
MFFLGYSIIRYIKLDPASLVLQRGEARLAHDALQHHAAGDHRRGLLLLELLLAGRAEALVQFGREILAPEIVRIGLARRAQRFQLLAALLNQLVLFLFQVRPPVSGWPR